MRHNRVRLRPGDQAELHARLERIHAFLRAAEHPDGEAYDVTTVLSRCVPRTGRKGR